MTDNPPAPVCSNPFLISSVEPEGKTKVFPLLNVASVFNVCSEPAVNFNLASTSVCNSAIAVDTVEAVVPNAAAEIVPSSASCSLIAVTRSVAVVVKLPTVPISVSCSLIAPTTVFAAGVKSAAFPTSPLNEFTATTTSVLNGIPESIAVISPTSSWTSFTASTILVETILITSPAEAAVLSLIILP